VHHLEEPAQALAEMVRVTRHNGWVVVMEPDFDACFVDSPRRELSRKIQHLLTDTVRNGQMGRQLWALFLDAGLQDVTSEPIGGAFTDLATADRLLWLERTAR